MDHATRIDTDQMMDMIRAMKAQEAKHYSLPGEYWETCFDLNIISLVEEDSSEGTEAECECDEADESDVPCIENYMEWRGRMIEWFFDVAKTCKYQTETIEVAINTMDRFMANSPRGNRIMQRSNEYQLVSMTSLYIATKTYEQECLSQGHVLKFTDQRYSVERLNRLEMEILQTLDFRVNPPTQTAYVKSLLSLIPNSVIIDKIQVQCLAAEQIEASLPETPFLPIQTSTAAFCAVMNAIQICLPTYMCDSAFQLHRIFRNVLEMDLSAAYSEYLETIQEELSLLIVFEDDDEGDVCEGDQHQTEEAVPKSRLPKRPEQPLQPINHVVDSPTFVSAMAA